MKTVRFSALVNSAGRPDIHLLFVKPEEDRTLQKAVRAKRVVTLFQTMVGSKTDHGEVGFRPGSSRQYVIFPKSVGAFEGRKVVGVKYELLESAPIPKAKQAPKPDPPRKARAPKAKRPMREPEPVHREEKKKEPSPDDKVVKFPEPAHSDPGDDEESEAIEDLKSQVRRAMVELEKGRQVAAFNLLKRIVED